MTLSQLVAAASGATPGPWFVDEDPRPGMSWNRSIDTDHLHGHTVCFMTHSDGKFPERDKATAELIAMCDPQTILALCEVVKAAQKLLPMMAECQEIARQWEPDDSSGADRRWLVRGREAAKELRAALSAFEREGG